MEKTGKPLDHKSCGPENHTEANPVCKTCGIDARAERKALIAWHVAQMSPVERFNSHVRMLFDEKFKDRTMARLTLDNATLYWASLSDEEKKHVRWVVESLCDLVFAEDR